MSELFPDLPEVLSPRLAWLQKHGVLLYFSDVEPTTWFAGLQSWWPEKSGGNFFIHEWGHRGDSRVGQGDTEDEAILDLCAHHGAPKHWTLEGEV